MFKNMKIGMRLALGFSLVVLLMMIVLFRSGLWGFLSMMPLTITIGFIYGMIGLVGKDYDMPVAVLSSLTLGLSVDWSQLYTTIGDRSLAAAERMAKQGVDVEVLDHLIIGQQRYVSLKERGLGFT